MSLTIVKCCCLVWGSKLRLDLALCSILYKASLKSDLLKRWLLWVWNAHTRRKLMASFPLEVGPERTVQAGIEEWDICIVLLSDLAEEWPKTVTLSGLLLHMVYKGHVVRVFLRMPVSNGWFAVIRQFHILKYYKPRMQRKLVCSLNCHYDLCLCLPQCLAVCPALWCPWTYTTKWSKEVGQSLSLKNKQSKNTDASKQEIVVNTMV